MVYIALDQTAKSCLTHFIKLIRSLALTLKTAFRKSLQDGYRFQCCKKCSNSLKRKGWQNAKQLYSLMSFVVAMDMTPPVEVTLKINSRLT